MALSEKYGRLDIPRIGEEEPVFILRPQNELTEPNIEMYRLLAAAHRAHQLAQALQKEFDRLRQWQHIKKLPD